MFDVRDEIDCDFVVEKEKHNKGFRFMVTYWSDFRNDEPTDIRFFEDRKAADSFADECVADDPFGQWSDVHVIRVVG